MTVNKVTDEQFQSSLHPNGVTIVDFSAPWCPPCRALLPILEELDNDLGGQIHFVQVNTDESPAVSAAYGIMSLPTVVVFKNGEPVEKLVGLRPKSQYLATIARLKGESPIIVPH